MPPSPFRLLSSKISWSCPWYQVRSDELLMPGGQRTQYHVVQHPGAVWIVPVTDSGMVVMIYNYRHTVGDWCWEVPAGALAQGESPLERARLELRQEVGGQARAWQPLGRFYTANGISNEIGHFFLATGVTLEQPEPEPAEVMEVHARPAAEALYMARHNQISDSPSVMALLLCEAELRRLGQGNAPAGAAHA